MAFMIVIEHEKKKFRVLAEQTLFAADKERFRVMGKDGDLEFESNRPLWRNKGVKDRPPNWKMISGNLSNMSFRESVVEALMKYLEPIKKRP